jgi:hypothetical protein
MRTFLSQEFTPRSEYDDANVIKEAEKYRDKRYRDPHAAALEDPNTYTEGDRTLTVGEAMIEEPRRRRHR